MSTRNPRNNAALAFTLLAVAGFLDFRHSCGRLYGRRDRGVRDPAAAPRQVLYGTYCVGCHGEAGRGSKGAAAMLIVKPRLHERALQVPLDAERPAADRPT